MFSVPWSQTLLVLIWLQHTVAQDCATTCRSFGIDFVDGGSYFQNVDSALNFTAYQDFTGCQNDTSNNILVDPSGTQYECSPTDMQPDSTQQLVTCPIEQRQLVSGNWSMIIISNNGDCDPIDYLRDFYLSVGVQSTTTVGPSITLTTTTTPITTTLVSLTSYVTSLARPQTTTVPGAHGVMTYTTTLGVSIVITSTPLYTVTSTSQVASIVATHTLTTTVPCAPTYKVADRQNRKVEVTVAPAAETVKPIERFFQIPNAAQKARSDSAEADHAVAEGPVPVVHEVRKRVVQKRHPDAPTVTVVNSSAPTTTSTSTITAPTLSITVTTTQLETKTVTPTITVSHGQPRVTTVTVPGRTITISVPAERRATTTITVTTSLTATFTTTVDACYY